MGKTSRWIFTKKFKLEERDLMWCPLSSFMHDISLLRHHLSCTSVPQSNLAFMPTEEHACYSGIQAQEQACYLCFQVEGTQLTHTAFKGFSPLPIQFNCTQLLLLPLGHHAQPNPLPFASITQHYPQQLAQTKSLKLSINSVSKRKSKRNCITNTPFT